MASPAEAPQGLLAPAGLGSRRFLRPRTILLLAATGLAILAAAVAVTARQSPNLGPQLACADVAHAVGLDFVGDYGTVYPALDAYGKVMQENMGNGAAVGDYDGDGYLDVLLLGQSGPPLEALPQRPGARRRAPLHAT